MSKCLMLLGWTMGFVPWQLPAPVVAPANATPLSTQEKVALFRRLFRGRTDVYPVSLGKQSRQERLLAGVRE